jgi:hypothetical protein
VTHGHQGELLNDRLWIISRLLLRYIWRPLQLIGIQNPTRVANSPKRQQAVEKELISWVEKTGIPLLCGHTHYAKFPNGGDPPYFNAGNCVNPRWITCIEIENGQIRLVKWQVKTNISGSLYVHRAVIGGPAALSQKIGEKPNSAGEPEKTALSVSGEMVSAP